MKITLKTCLISSVLALTATAATADPGYYYGIGLAYSAADSESGPGPGSSSDANGAAVGLTFGYRFENASAFYGPELDADLFISGDFAESITGIECSGGALGPYYCKRKATIRLRGIYGQSMGNGLEWFGALGMGVMMGDGAINPGGATDRGVSSGVTVGLGLQKRLNAGGMLRGEVIHDRFTNTLTKPIGLGEPTYEATTLKISYIMNF